MEIKSKRTILGINKVLNKFWNESSKCSAVEFKPLFYYLEGKEIIGFLYAYDINDGYFREVYLDDLCIKEKFRGKGYGKRLVKELIKYCKRNKIELIKLRVQKNNKKAINVYKKCGFKIDEEDLVMDLHLK